MQKRFSPVRVVAIFTTCLSAAILLPVVVNGEEPSNDDFADSITIPLLPYTNDQLTVNATVEPDEPQPCGEVSSTVWYSFTVPEPTFVFADTFGSMFDTVLAVYKGDSLADLELLDCNDDTGFEQQSQVLTEANPGENYHLQVGGFDGAWGTLTINVGEYVPPPNDDFENGIEIGTFPYDDGQPTKGTSIESQEPQPCGNISATIWYEFKLTEDRYIVVDTFGSDYDTVVAAHTGDDLAELELVECNDDAGPGLESMIGFMAEPDVYYRIQAGGYYGETGNLTINAEAYVPPPNDDFENASIIKSLPYSTTQNTVGATEEQGEPSPCGQIGSTVWFTYTSDIPRFIAANSYGSNYNTVVAAYAQINGSLWELDCNVNVGGNQNSAIRFLALPGIPVYIQAGGYNGTMGTLILNVSGLP